MAKSKPYIIVIAVLLIGLIAFYFLGEIVLPFIIGLLGAYLVSPLIKKLQRFIPNRNLAVTSFLLLAVILSAGIFYLFGSEIVDDFKRLNGAFKTFAQDNSAQIDETNETIKSYIQEIYSMEVVQDEIHQLENQQDSLAQNGMGDLKSALSGITSFLGSGSKESAEVSDVNTGLNWIVIFFSSIVYFLYILFTWDYYEKRFKKYFDSGVRSNTSIQSFILDFKRIFLDYFRKRTKVVLICMAFFICSFLILNIPGAILIGVIAGLLCYIAHFHYLTLIPLSLSCWVLSMETQVNFFVFFGIVFGLFLIVSILEEFVFIPKIMKGFNGLNPAIMLVSFAIWIYLFGTVLGTLIALPLTTIFLIYFDRLLVYLKSNLGANQVN
ncbi:MAG: AI-2E family transporter [Crocinitomicaceae bacterium]|nr:AI-2E family transporter [Crocinitomicaceae bacterium]